MIKRFILFILLASVFASCSFEKRLYRPGFYIDRKSTRQESAGVTLKAGQAQTEEPFVAAARPVEVPAPVETETAALPLLQQKIKQAAPALHLFSPVTFTEKIQVQAQRHFHKAKARPRTGGVSEEVKNAFWAGFIMLFLVAPLSGAVILWPESFIEGSSDGGWFLLTAPIFTVGFIFFAPGLIRHCAEGMRKRKDDAKTQAMGAAGILFCVLASLCSIGTVALLAMHPEMLLVIGLAALITLIYMLLSAL